MHRIAVWVVCAWLVAPVASAQSQYKCYSASGQVWYQSNQCPTPSPYGNDLRKCVSRKGEVSFQQEDCPPGWRLASVRAVVPEAPLTLEQRRAQEARRRQGEAESRYLSSLAGTNRTGNSGAQLHRVGTGAGSPSACDAAKAHRESVLNAVGMRRTYDLLRALNDQVFAACK